MIKSVRSVTVDVYSEVDYTHLVCIVAAQRISSSHFFVVVASIDMKGDR